MRKYLGGVLAILILSTRIVSEVIRHLDQYPLVVCAYAHHPSYHSFEKVVNWLRSKHFYFVSDREMMDFISGGDRLPPRSIWLSFDDGRKELLQDVVPLLHKYGLPATFFICPEAIERGCLWYELYNHHFSPKLKSAQDFSRITYAERQRIVDALSQSGTFKPERTMMTPAEIMALSHHPNISIQNHTYSHPILSNCTEEEVTRECLLAAEKILNWTGTQPDILAYPCGHFRGEHLHLIQRTGIKMAVTNTPGFLDRNSFKSPLLMPRTAFIDNGTLAENICQILGIWQPVINRIKKGDKNLRRYRDENDAKQAGMKSCDPSSKGPR